jgi:NADH dehydrogenase/NADH:ubiquinone oxidoreductase subunit G
VTAPGQVDAAPSSSAASSSAAGASPRRPLHPLVRQHGVLEPAPLEQALLRTVALLRGRSAVLAAPTLTNEAVLMLDRELRPAAPQAHYGFLPRASTAWPVQGRIASLPACRKVLLLGLDPWTELPVLALWLRKAALNGGSVVAVGPRNGLFRDTAAWLQVGEDGVEERARELLAALQQDRFAGRIGEPARAAAAKLLPNGPAAVLLHPALAEQPEILQLARSLAQQLGAEPGTGLLGAPAFGANARGAQDAAPQIASSVVDAQGLTGLLLLGVEELPPPCGARIALATAHELPSRDDIEVVLPMLHPYETAGTYTNFAGEKQRLQAGGFVGRGIPTDQQLLSRLRTALQHQHAGAR